ncbi:MAG: spermidine/putrescine ABC transporter substrate-binding protein [Actinomycetota bacterium]|nr:spermidine/putrescine ABC transporter substrate-binding protein [Actinomycetota bacterium]
MSEKPESTSAEQMDPSLIRGLTMPRMSRRGFLGLAGAGLLGAVAAACGSSSSSSSSGKFSWSTAKKTGQLDFANWPLYIDQETVNGKTVYPTLQQFTKETGIKVNYQEVIQGNTSFFGKIEPNLKAGKPTGYDLMVISNGPILNSLMLYNWLTPLDHSYLPNFAKYAGASYKDPTYDPGNKYTAAWQSGFTGIAYNPKLTDGPITSLASLFDPKYAGKVGMLNAEDTPNLVMLYLGIDPNTATEADWKKAAAAMTKQKNEGIVRKYYQQNYINALENGDVAISIAYSGDIFQANQSSKGSDLKFVVPTEGVYRWTDNMCIPANSLHPVDAITYMNYVYNPRVAATMAEYINYMTPVPASKQYVIQDADATSGSNKAGLLAIADSPLVYPDAADFAHAYYGRNLSPSEYATWNSIFQPIYQA